MNLYPFYSGHGMNKAKTVYYDKNGNMVKNLRYENKKELTKTDIAKDTVVSKSGMRLISITPLRSGVTFWFEDADKKLYPMTDTVFNHYIKDNPIDFGDMNIEFLKKGEVYSIGFVKENKE